jgi:hypothetical protein
MRKVLVVLLMLPLMALAQPKHDAAEIKKDIERHKQMAAAHDAMARCLESGSNPDQCQKALQGACKGLAIGKYCGMKHEH